jgi:hypothetical protein
MDNNIVPTLYKSIEALLAWAEDIEREIAEITSKIIPLQQQLDAEREKLDLVRRLIHLSTPNPTSMSKKTSETPLSTQSSNLPVIEDRIEDILRTNGKPMHISELRDSLIQMGVPLPGRGDEANIILRLRRSSDRFIRTERGTYALTSWGIPEYSPTPNKKRVLKRRKTMP